MHLGWSSLSTRSNFVMCCPNIVCDKWRQRRVDLFSWVKLVLRIVTCSCSLLYLCTRGSNHCRVLLNLILVCYHQLAVVCIWIHTCFLKSHCVIRCFIFLVNAQTKMRLHCSPRHRPVGRRGLGKLTNVGTRSVLKTSLLSAQIKIMCFQVVHQLISLGLVKLTFVCLRTKFPIADWLFEALLVNEIGLLVFNLIRESEWLIVMRPTLCLVLSQTGWGVRGWTLPHVKVCLRQSQLLLSNEFRVRLVDVAEALVDAMLGSRVIQRLLIFGHLPIISDWARADTRL